MSRLTERELAFLLTKLRETHPDEARRLEEHLDAHRSEFEFLELFERIITSSSEATSSSQAVAKVLETNTAAVGRVETLMRRLVEAREEANRIAREAAEHERAVETQRQAHEQELAATRVRERFKLAGALVGGGGLVQILQMVFGG